MSVVAYIDAVIPSVPPDAALAVAASTDHQHYLATHQEALGARDGVTHEWPDGAAVDTAVVVARETRDRRLDNLPGSTVFLQPILVLVGGGDGYIISRVPVPDVQQIVEDLARVETIVAVDLDTVHGQLAATLSHDVVNS